MTRRFKRWLCYCSTATIALLSGIMSLHYSVRPTRCVLAIDLNLSESITNEIQQFVNEQLPKHRSLCSLGSSLKNQFQIIDEISVRHKVPQLAYINITARKPVIVINDQWLLIDNGRVIPSTYYSSNPRIFLKMQSDIDLPNQAEYLLAMAKNFDPVIWAHYDVHWQDHTAIYLHDRQEAHFCIIAHAQMQFNQDLLKRIKALKSLMCKKVTKEQTRWIADVRFRNQIILSPGNLNFKDRNGSQSKILGSPNQDLIPNGEFKDGEVL